MNKYKVTLGKRLFSGEDMNTNPFVSQISMTKRVNVSVREWEIEAENEEQIRQFYKEAKEQDLPNVRGYELRSIELIEPTHTRAGDIER